MTPTILAVDDDPTLLRFLAEFLEHEGFRVVKADRGQAALKLFFEERPDLVVLDLMMPGMDGWEVCARIREMSKTPVILLTAKGSEADKLRGFRLGVDDYVTKPFSLAELTARVQAVLARSATRVEGELSLVQSGELTVDLKKREAMLGGEKLPLTRTEFRLLAYLAQHAGEAVPQEALVAEIWGRDSRRGGSALRRYIWLLRRKLEPDPANPRLLVNVHGFGYRLER
ncbi:MAG TPA: response regulator transcription factor [Anaerolineales bacterium]|nr:response regulator transcription factor [Anaerolineales bacterium]